MKENLAGYDLTAGIHTISVKTQDTICVTPEITQHSKNLTNGMTTLKINVNKKQGFVQDYATFCTILNEILLKAGVKNYDLIRVDMCFDSYDAEYYSKFAKLNRLLISMIAHAYSVRNKYKTSDLFTNKQLSVAIKNPNSFEVENYDKEYESQGKDIAKSRFEIRSTRMSSKDIEYEFTEGWNERFMKALACYEETLQRYNAELIKIYHAENEKQCGLKPTTFFRIYENCIFTRSQAIDLLSQMGEQNPEEKYKYIKKKQKLITYTKKDIEFAISELQRARDVFFFAGQEITPLNFVAHNRIA